MNDLIYVYCISDKRLENIRDFDLKTVENIQVGDFFAIIKRVSAAEFSEVNFKANLSNAEWLEKNAREHILVISRIMEAGPLIPFRFGTIYYSREGLEKFVTDFSISLTDNFNYIRGKEEWAVKIYCDRRILADQIDELSEEASNLEVQIMGSSPGKAFLLKRKKSELIEIEMDRLCKNFGQAYFNELRDLSIATGLNNLLPKEFTGRNDTMMLNATFLVESEKIGLFSATVEVMKTKAGKSGFFIEQTGPWPLFSFVHIKENPKQ